MSAADKPDEQHGEGNYKASREYNDATKKFVESGKVEQAARDAKPATQSEAMQMAKAEAEGRSRAKEEDPALSGRSKENPKDRQVDSRGKPVTDRSADETKTPEPGSERE